MEGNKESSGLLTPNKLLEILKSHYSNERLKNLQENIQSKVSLVAQNKTLEKEQYQAISAIITHQLETIDLFEKNYLKSKRAIQILKKQYKNSGQVHEVKEIEQVISTIENALKKNVFKLPIKEILRKQLEFAQSQNISKLRKYVKKEQQFSEAIFKKSSNKNYNLLSAATALLLLAMALSSPTRADNCIDYIEHTGGYLTISQHLESNKDQFETIPGLEGLKVYGYKFPIGMKVLKTYFTQIESHKELGIKNVILTKDIALAGRNCEAQENENTHVAGLASDYHDTIVLAIPEFREGIDVAHQTIIFFAITEHEIVHLRHQELLKKNPGFDKEYAKIGSAYINSEWGAKDYSRTNTSEDIAVLIDSVFGEFINIRIKQKRNVTNIPDLLKEFQKRGRVVGDFNVLVKKAKKLFDNNLFPKGFTFIEN